MRSVNSAVECVRLAQLDRSFAYPSECELGRGKESRKRKYRYQGKGEMTTDLVGISNVVGVKMEIFNTARLAKLEVDNSVEVNAWERARVVTQ